MNKTKVCGELFMKVCTELRTRSVSTVCPHCDKENDGWICDPRGQIDACEHCGESYVVHQDADIDYL